MRKTTTIILLAVMFFTALLIAGCNRNGNDHNSTAETQSVGGDDGTVRYRVSEKKDFYIPLYDWYRRTQRSLDGKGQVYWNNQIANKLHCNWINVFPSGKSRDGERGLPGAFLLDVDRIIEYTAKGLEDSHKLGIKVMTSAPIAEVFQDTWLDWGIDPTEMLTWGGKSGKRIINDSGLNHACNNDPEWQRYLIVYTEKMAEAGFDGCLYDGYTYAYDPGYYCFCEDCLASWKEFCLDLYGEEKPFPTARNLAVHTDTDEVDRAYVVWRLKTQSDLYNSLLAAGRKYNPDFEVYINSTMYDISLTYFYLNGLDVTSSEFKHVLGHENSMFMYVMHEALSDKQLISFTNVYTNQYKTIKEYYVEIMTAFASGGAMCEAEVSRTKDMDFYVTDVTTRLGEILTDENEQYKFRSSGNAAKATVFYSWRDTNYFQVKGFAEFRSAGGTNIREKYDNCSSRRVAVNLARAGIPFSYMVEETNPTDEDFAYCGTIIIPELTILDRDTEERLLQYVKQGGSIIIAGSVFGTCYSLDENGLRLEKRDYDVLEKWTGTSLRNSEKYAVYTVGSGKIVVCKNYVTNTEVELSSALSETMIRALEETGAAAQVRIDTQPPQGYICTSLRANASGTEMYLHLINYDVDDSFVAGSYTVSVEIPEGSTVSGAAVKSPFYNGDGNFGWEVKNGRIYFTGDFDIYSYITINLNYQN
ncbi:MAG: hypothetical protein J5563_04300 [Clostridia bacterium]|nr:hypothetical protein [Clostridia bacterium]